MAAVDRGSVEEFERSGGTVAKVPQVTKNAATSGRMSNWQSCASSDDPSAVDGPVSSAMRYAERCAVEFGFVLCPSRPSRSRLRASVFVEDSAYPYWAFSSCLEPLHLAVEPYCL